MTRSGRGRCSCCSVGVRGQEVDGIPLAKGVVGGSRDSAGADHLCQDNNTPV